MPTKYLNNITVVKNRSNFLIGIAAGVTVGLTLILIGLLIAIVISRKRYLYIASHVLLLLGTSFSLHPLLLSILITYSRTSLYRYLG